MELRTTFACRPRRAAWLPATIGLLVLTASMAQANNIRVANMTLTKQDPVTKTANVGFDLTWDNSWRGSENWDAAWVFVKFRAPGSSVWEHAILSANSAAHRPAANSVIAAVPDGRGVFVYRSTNYTGSVSYAQTKLRWQYGSNGCNFAAGAVVEVSAQAIEMVYIPAGAFYLGSGGGEPSHFYQYTDGVQTTLPYLVTSETNAITVGTNSGNLYYDYYYSPDFGQVGDQFGPISSLFPKGFAAFYCMKYELSQGQYAEFLNKLTPAQTNARYYVGSTFRYTIGWNAINYYSAGVPDRACNCLSWGDGIAYADWAALRPITELEYEKACRGAAYPVSNEFAWGSTNITQLKTETGDGTGISTVNTDAGANCCYANSTTMQGPTRVGIFAATNLTRVSSGAGYYGVMELSGNMFEMTVTVGTSVGRAFMGSLGDGLLAADGNATNNADWPGINALGAGSRGGSWYWQLPSPCVSAREHATFAPVGREAYVQGVRAVRPAP